MPASKDEVPASSSESDSSYETVDVEEETAAWALAAATPKSAALPAAPKLAAKAKACAAPAEGAETEPESLLSETPELDPGREPEAEVAPEESSDSCAGLSRRKRMETAGPAGRRGRSPQRGAPPARASKHFPPPEPLHPPSSKGRSKGRSKCGICWRRIGPSDSSRDQHTYWNVNCLSWQQWDSGRHATWQAACEAAEAQKVRREQRARRRNEEEKPAKPKEKKEKVHKAKSKEVKQKARAAVRNKEKKGRKEKAKKRVRDSREEPWPSPSPDPARHKRDRRPPSSDDSGEGGAVKPRLRQTGPCTWKIVMGR